MPTGKEWEDIEETSKDMLDIYIYMCGICILVKM